jgi:hypothetical protein
MRRVTIIRQTQTNHKALDIEIARLRGLDVKELRARWRVILRKEAPSHLPRHLLFRILAYRLQAHAQGDLDDASRRFLEQLQAPDRNTQQRIQSKPAALVLQPGTILSREWNGHMHRVAVLAEGFAWNGKTYRSLSKAAFAITGTHWNGPRFFGLRDNGKARLESRQ